VKKKRNLKGQRKRRIDGGWFKAISGFKVEIAEKGFLKDKKKMVAGKLKLVSISHWTSSKVTLN
jgi:hypothetical protein